MAGPRKQQPPAPKQKRAPAGDDLTFVTKKTRGKKAIPLTIDGEVFNCRPSLPAPVLYEHTKLLKALEVMQPGAEANVAAADAILGFFKLAMGEEEFERFWAFLSEDGRETEWDTLGEMHRALLRRYGKRPTGRSSG